MKRLLSLVAFFATLHASAQQVNPVPDYVFANRMSAGRNTVTDTAAYLSIGPRYGATRGMMPPMVVDTASFSGNKRNGLLIFSVQKNKFLYWDSVGVKWAEMAGTGGSAISSGDTAAMLLPYVRHAGYGLTKSGQSFLVDTLNISTRAWRQKGLDSLAALEVSGSGTTNYVPKFTAASTIGNSLIRDNGTAIGINVAPPTSSAFVLHVSDGGIIGGAAQYTHFSSNVNYTTDWKYNITSPAARYSHELGAHTFHTAATGTAGNTITWDERLRIFANGRVGVNTTTDAGYQFDVAGSIRNTTGANFATSSGSVGIGTTTTNSRLTIFESLGNAAITLRGRDDVGQPTTPVAVGYIEGRNALNNFVGSAIRMGASKTAGRIEFLAARNGTLTPYATIDTTGNFFISEGDNQWGTEKLDVNGRIRVRTIDSTSTNMNILYADANGVIKKSGNIETSGTIRTGAPSGGSIKPWKIGEAATVSPTSPNRTIRVEIDGTVYYIHAKTTND